MLIKLIRTVFLLYSLYSGSVCSIGESTKSSNTSIAGECKPLTGRPQHNSTLHKYMPINYTTYKVPTQYLIGFNKSVENDLTFYKQQFELLNRFKRELRTIYEDHFNETLKIRVNRKQNLTKFKFNKRSLCSRLVNTTFNQVYKAYLVDLQSVFNQFEYLVSNLEHLIRLNERAKDKINFEIRRMENYFDNGFGDLPIRHKLTDYTASLALEIDFTKEQMRFHFFNFFFLSKLLLAKERWLADQQSNKLLKNLHQLGPLHALAYSRKSYQIKIIELISKKQFLERNSN